MRNVFPFVTLSENTIYFYGLYGMDFFLMLYGFCFISNSYPYFLFCFCQELYDKGEKRWMTNSFMSSLLLVLQQRKRDDEV